MPKPLPALVIAAAVGAQLPEGYAADWQLGPLYMIDRGGGRRRIVQQIDRHSKRAVACPVVPDVDPILVDQLRADFLAWRDALRRIVGEAAKAGLRSWRLVGPDVPPAPWEQLTGPSAINP